jgi:CubicO group peptidase (beta-lactamase class C family)
MSGTPRSLPDQPSLRYLKLEAKRRLAAGEFATLHDAQLRIAREHGLPSWNALRQAIEKGASAPSPALDQVKWLVSRFSRADDGGWDAPPDSELREHFTDHFLAALTPDRVVATLARQAAELRDELSVVLAERLRVRAQIGGIQIEAAAQTEPPHRLSGLRLYPVGGKVADGRIAAPTTRSQGEPPDGAVGVAEEAFAELGLVGLALAAGSRASGPAASWVTATGWARLDPEPAELRPEHRFPAYSVTKLITGTAVLRLVADGRAELDRPANDYLRTVRLSDDTVTVRDLLSHRGGVSTPFGLFAGRVPALADLAGPVLPCSGPRGEFAYSNGGYAALGQLIGDLTGESYPDVATRLVLEPLAMTSSFFPAAWPQRTDTVSGFAVTGDGSVEPSPPLICTVPAAGGLWATAADLVRFGLCWSSLLPDALAAEALTPHSARPGAVQVGLGWHLNTARELAGHPGGGSGGAASLVLAREPGRAHVAMTNRRLAIEPVNGRVMRLMGLLE